MAANRKTKEPPKQFCWTSISRVEPGDIVEDPRSGKSHEVVQVNDGSESRLMAGVKTADGKFVHEAPAGIKVLKPLVEGLPATIQVGSDYYPATVRDVTPSGKTIRVTKDRYCGNGFTEPVDGELIEFTMRNDGVYRRRGEDFRTLILGIRKKETDPHF